MSQVSFLVIAVVVGATVAFLTGRLAARLLEHASKNTTNGSPPSPAKAADAQPGQSQAAQPDPGLRMTSEVQAAAAEVARHTESVVKWSQSLQQLGASMESILNQAQRLSHSASFAAARGAKHDPQLAPVAAQLQEVADRAAALAEEAKNRLASVGHDPTGRPATAAGLVWDPTSSAADLRRAAELLLRQSLLR